jgi:hypothetical protein
MFSDRLKKNVFILFFCMGFSLFAWATSQAIEGKAGEVIKTMEQLKDLNARGVICQGYVNDLGELIEHGHSIEIVETTDRTLCHSNGFLEVSRQNKGKAKIGSNNELVGYEGGRPFMDLTTDDPQFAIKAAWNQEYRYRSDGFPTTWNYYLTDAKGRVKRLWGYADNVMCNFRTDIEPKPVWNPKEPDVRNKYIITFDGPFESKGLSQLAVKYVDPNRSNDVWTYVPGLRRATRTGAAAGCDALGGFVSVMDDDYGFNGNILDFTYEFVGEAEMLVPTLSGLDEKWPIPPGLHSPIAKLERRVVWIINQIPKDPNYCYSKREWFLDPETYTIINVQNYHQDGTLWKNYWLGYRAYPNSPAIGGASLQIATGGCTDYRIMEGGPLHIETGGSNVPYTPADFTLDAMRRRGR